MWTEDTSKSAYWYSLSSLGGMIYGESTYGEADYGEAYFAAIGSGLWIGLSIGNAGW